MDYSLTPQQMTEIQEWLNGRASAPAETLRAYFRLGEAIRSKLMADTAAATNKVHHLETRLERYRRQDEQDALEGNFESLGIDTITIAKAVLWKAYEKHLPVENKTRFRLLVFSVYCAWLGSQQQRVTLEHPQAQVSYGPVLATMLDEKKVRYNEIPANTEYKSVASMNPGLAATIENCVVKYCSCSLQALKEHFMGKGTPFSKSAAECAKTGKGTIEMSDKDIYLWKKTHA